MFSTSHICTYTPEDKDEVTNSNHFVKIYKHILELYDKVLTIFVKFSAHVRGHVSAQLQYAFRLKRLTKKGNLEYFSIYVDEYHLFISVLRQNDLLHISFYLHSRVSFFLLFRTKAYTHYTSIASILVSIL